MELKIYQQDTIADLERFLEKIQEVKELKTAFNDFWKEHPKIPLQPFPGSAVEPYKDNIPGVPHICLKVPTAGGKTFIACNALRTIFQAFDTDKTRIVVWLVPSITILDQTIKNLKDTSHPYRQKLNAHFGNRVEIFDKNSLLQGTGFNSAAVQEQLSVIVMSFDSIRVHVRNQEDRKVYQENSNLQSFETVVGNAEDLTVMKVIKTLNPVVIVDESHNAESELSLEMLMNLNPCFILDLTATPRRNSNIISFVDAIELKKENMVKLPVIVYNHHDKNDVVLSALELQRKLEAEAIEEQKNGGRYIRPIVLFQAQPRNDEDNTTFEKLKEKLIELKIPEEQIKIKTASINEIKSVDLMSPECPVRYIITVNALKEGWDCPFAYILASIADRSSAVDVEQIVGRVLRQPYVTPHERPFLNLSYVLTASARFLETLDNIVKGLNRAGFSDKDYKLTEQQQAGEKHQPDAAAQLTVFGKAGDEQYDGSLWDIDTERIMAMIEQPGAPAPVSSIETLALEQHNAFQAMVEQQTATGQPNAPNEIQSMIKSYPNKKIFDGMIDRIILPHFFLRTPANDLFGQREEEIFLEKDNLLKGFQLSKCDTNIAFDNAVSELYKIDLDDTRKDHTPTFIKLDGSFRQRIISHLLDPAQKNSRVKNFGRWIVGQLGNMDALPEKELTKYVERVLADFDDEQFKDLFNNKFSYAGKFKEKIKSLCEHYQLQQFSDLLDKDKIIIKPSYRLPAVVVPGETAKDIPGSLYEKEAALNTFEERVINEVANLPNIAFWTKNIERRGFCINGFINHYPDFIIHTKGGKTLLLETKGDHLNAEQKIRLGNLWQAKAGNAFRYCMVYEKRAVDGAYTLDRFIDIIRDLA